MPRGLTLFKYVIIIIVLGDREQAGVGVGGRGCRDWENGGVGGGLARLVCIVCVCK